MNEKMNEQQICKQALEIQNACNLSGVVHAFSRAMTALWEVARSEGDPVIGRGTEWVNTHPAAVLFADKIRSLTLPGGEDIMVKWDECERIANGTNINQEGEAA